MELLSLFQSTHPRGVRHLPRKETCHHHKFQSTHPRGVRPIECKQCSHGCVLFQSTHPRGVRPGDRHPRDHQQPVSIHAPAWGATIVFLLFKACDTVSIHAPAWGATPESPVLVILRLSFNPRTRVGCDLMLNPLLLSVLSFNPRTRVGCDGKTLLLVARMACFNPRTRVGCDALVALLLHRHQPFQSTHPRGVRRVATSTLAFWRCRFQSTHPRGVRQMLRGIRQR